MNGLAISKGVDLCSLDLTDFLDFTYWWATRNSSEEDTRKLDLDLWRTPPAAIVKMSKEQKRATYEEQMRSFHAMGAAFS